MRHALGALALVVGAAGCAPVKLAAGARVAVELSSREPDRACALVGAVELRSPGGAASAGQLLGAWALERGGNYVVLDAFSVVSEPALEVITRARLFACPPPRFARAR
ncbi:MAG TPA: hypothetical protein VFF06_05800 [Polyangia bacterium]|nr:hypothetical protein [Polyangia bacterium]